MRHRVIQSDQTQLSFSRTLTNIYTLVNRIEYDSQL